MSDDVLQEQSKIITRLMSKLIRQLFTIDVDDPAMDLPIAQMRVCAYLRCKPRTMSVLSKELGISLSAMTQIADRLERAKLVERVAETEDRRVKMLQLTPYGAEIMQRRRERHRNRVREALEQMPPESRKNVADALHSLLNAAGAIAIEAPDDILITEPLDS